VSKNIGWAVHKGPAFCSHLPSCRRPQTSDEDTCVLKAPEAATPVLPPPPVRTMAAPLVGRRVTISNLQARPELNGTGGLALSFDDAKGRYNVKLDSTGGMTALKPANLAAADGAGGPSVGGANSGGFPFGGRMPSGTAALPALLARLFGAMGGVGDALPGGLTPRSLCTGAIAAFFVLPRALGLSVTQSLMLVGLGGFLAVSLNGESNAEGIKGRLKGVVGSVRSAVGRVSGRPISEAQAALFLVAALVLVWKYALAPSFGSGDGEPGGRGADSRGYGAYSKGYNDGRKSLPFDPITDSHSEPQQQKSSWGISSLFSLMMAGSMLMQMAGRPPSFETLIANLKHANPMQLVMLFSVFSNLFF
jgi:hypothetical protein